MKVEPIYQNSIWAMFRTDPNINNPLANHEYAVKKTAKNVIVIINRFKVTDHSMDFLIKAFPPALILVEGAMTDRLFSYCDTEREARVFAWMCDETIATITARIQVLSNLKYQPRKKEECEQYILQLVEVSGVSAYDSNPEEYIDTIAIKAIYAGFKSVGRRTMASQVENSVLFSKLGINERDDERSFSFVN
jgi:hypothetical protein